MKIVNVKDKYSLIALIVDMALMLQLPDSYKLRGREKEFLINCTLFYNQGLSLESKEMVQKLEEVMNVKNRDVYNYRNRMKKTGWFIQTPRGLELISSLNFKNKNIPSTINVNFKLTIDDNRG